MNKSLVAASLAAMVAACASVQEVDRQPSSGKLGVVQVGTQQNAELIFCKSENCPQRTPKRLPPPAPTVVAFQGAFPLGLEPPGHGWPQGSRSRCSFRVAQKRQTHRNCWPHRSDRAAQVQREAGCSPCRNRQGCTGNGWHLGRPNYGSSA